MKNNSKIYFIFFVNNNKIKELVETLKLIVILI